MASDNLVSYYLSLFMFLASCKAMNINPCLGFSVLHAGSTASAVCPYGSQW